MFIKDDDSKLVFIRSNNIDVFPCGRRRSSLIDRDGNDATVNDKYYIPFDPEARLNTEANNRKHSGLNGFKQSFINNWTYDESSGELSLVLAGYLFTIRLNTDVKTPESFGGVLSSKEYLGQAIDKLFVNIKLTDIEFFSGRSITAKTAILRDQTLNSEPSECLDLPGTDNEYYFYGLSLSSSALAETNEDCISLQLLECNNNKWEIRQASKLPRVDHGDIANSVKIPGSLTIEDYIDENGSVTKGDLTVSNNIAANAFVVKNSDGSTTNAVTLEVVTDDNVTNQLQFWTIPKPKD